MLISLASMALALAAGTHHEHHARLPDGSTVDCAALTAPQLTAAEYATFLADDCAAWADWYAILEPALAGDATLGPDVLAACAQTAVTTCGAGNVCGISVLGGTVPYCSFTCGKPPCSAPLPPPPNTPTPPPAESAVD